MEEMERLRSDMSQLTRRIDDFSLRLAVVEQERKGIEDKIDSLRELFDIKLGSVQRSVDGWNKIGFWLLTTVGGAVIIAVLGLVLIRPH